MSELNLPTFDVKLGGTREKPEIFDFLRRRYVALTPEEWVRQHFTHWLVEHKGYPKGLLGNEIELRIGDKRLRCDSILYNKEAQPQMIIEYKAPTVSITQRVFNQISAYNLLLHVNYLIVSNGLQHYCCQMDYEQQSYQFLQEVPDYSAIIAK
ncbi:MAG: type I restriction enzyme HsdR N-terminal domain-containing protein [Prevotella sp.]|nr:type I restriction enzyme HsdR N-terminal domain-containing protein [Prevotella sp.]